MRDGEGGERRYLVRYDIEKFRKDIPIKLSSLWKINFSHDVVRFMEK